MPSCSSKYAASFTDANLSAGVLAVGHGLAGFVQCAVYDDDDRQVVPGEVTVVDDDNLEIDLSAFGSLPGTWHVVVVG